MIELLLWLGSAAVFLAAGVAAGWHFGRAREMKRVSRRVSIVLSQVERRHKKELNRFQTTFAKQAQELKEARAKQRLREAADNLASAQVHARSPGHPQATRHSPPEKPTLPEHGFAPTQPMQHANR
jgi:HAMP domain-containing protein